jgi:hypothetical protein
LSSRTIGRDVDLDGSEVGVDVLDVTALPSDVADDRDADAGELDDETTLSRTHAQV